MFFVATEKSVSDGVDPMELHVYDFKGLGVALSMYNSDEVQ
jgi:isocitrate dehydrogenase